VARYIEPLSDIVKFEPRLVTYPCPGCDAKFKRVNCVSNGTFCGMKHSEKLQLDGAAIVMEGLREHCIFTINSREKGKQFFEYVKRAHEVFRTRITQEDSEKVMDGLEINQGLIEQCVERSFADGDPEHANNTLLAEMQQ